MNELKGEELIRRFVKDSVADVAQSTKDDENEDFGESDGNGVHPAD
jgi:hypothetical protein